MKSRPLIATLALVGAALSFAFAPSDEAKTGKKLVATYSGGVGEILNRSCVNCHRPGEVAPFSLIGYENSKKWSKMIASVTEAKLMPPFKASNHGIFLDDNSLSPEEIALLKTWADAGAPRGDRKAEPAPPKFASGWTLGEPDLVISPSKPITVGAEGPDEYRNWVIKTNFPQTRYLTAVDCKPGNKAISHHLVMYLDSSGAAEKLEKEKGDGKGGYLSNGGITPGFIPESIPYIWVPGLRPHHMPEGVAFEVKPGASVVMQMHYHKDGKPETDLTKLGLYFAKTKPVKTAEIDAILDFRLVLPAGKVTKWERTTTISEDRTIYAIMPHMHLLGKSMRAELTFPDGTKRELVNVDQWDFNWQFNYTFKEPVKVPKGSKLHVEAVYDNTAENPRNPSNPPKTVKFGEQTTDEMFVLVYTASWGF